MYSKRLGRVNSNGDVVSFPYYGALKGHSLNVAKQGGKVNTVVVLNPKYAEGRGTSDTLFNKIQDSAGRLVTIQEKAKQKGSFTEEDNKSYADSLFELGLAAQGLAQLQQSGEIKDFSKLLQGSNTQNKPEGAYENPLVQEEPYDDSGESVLVNAPKKDASVAEAKPVGLAIAGEGGVASSKPNAVAIAGREGLAVASPKATAIAGVSPEEAAAFSVNVPARNDIIIKSQQRGNISGATSTENKSPLEETNIAKRKSQVVDDSGINILLVEPRFAERIALKENSHKTSKVNQADVKPKGFRFQNEPSGISNENIYLSNMAYGNNFMSYLS